jgi:hypothetical protein
MVEWWSCSNPRAEKKVCCIFSPRPDPGETTAIPSPPHIRVVSSRVRFVCLRRRPPLAGVFRCLCFVSVADDFAGIGWTARHSPGTDFDGVEPDQTHHHSTRQAALLVEIGPEGRAPTQQPPELTPYLRPFLRGSYFYVYLGEERKRRNLRRRNKENTLQTEDRRTGKGLRCSLLITGYPFHYKGVHYL